MLEQGLEKSELDINNFLEKPFYTFRKTKVHSKASFIRYHKINLINKHYTRNVEDILLMLDE